MFADYILSEDIEVLKIPQAPEAEEDQNTEEVEQDQAQVEPVEEENEIAVAFRFIEKLRKIKYAYESQELELKKTVIEIRKNKEAIFSKQLEGDGSKIIPVWENIAKMADNGEFDPFTIIRPFSLGMMKDDYKFRIYDQLTFNTTTQEMNTKAQLLQLLFPQYASKVSGFEDILEIGLNSEETLVENQIVDKHLRELFMFFGKGEANSYLSTLISDVNSLINVLTIYAVNPNPTVDNGEVSESMYRSALLGALLKEEDDDIPSVPTPETGDEDNSDEPEEDNNQNDDEIENQEEDDSQGNNTNEENPFKKPIFNKALWAVEVISLLYKVLMKNSIDALGIINLYSPTPIELVEVTGDVAPDQPESENTEDETSDNDEDIPEAPEEDDNEQSDDSEQQAQEDESESMNTDITEEDDSDKEF